MVSSSLTQVAPLPAMHEQAKNLTSVHVATEPRRSLKGVPNGHAHRDPFSERGPEPSHEPLDANGSAVVADAYSEPSTTESADVSPRSGEIGVPSPEFTETFVDAPQMILPSQDNQHTNDSGIEIESDGVGPPAIAVNGATKTPQEPRMTATHNKEGDAMLKPEAASQIAADTNKHATSQNSDGSAAQVAKKNEDQDPQEHGSRKSQEQEPQEQEPLASASKSTASKRAAAVAAEELNDDVLVGTRVSEGHENFVTAYNMLTGIRVAVSRCTAKNNRPLTDADFNETDEISFDLSGGGSNPSSKFIFHFKDYAPWVFRHLRDAFRLDPVDYLMSLTAKYIVSELGSPGKSGSFFYYSRDYRFIIKTIRHSEHKLLRRILREYYSHIQSNPNTLVSQFYGLHRVRLPFGRKIHFVVMNNVFPALYEIHERYDLKGSLLGRQYHPDLTKPVVVFKDLDWLRNHRRIVLGPEKRERLVSQLEKDTRFLERVNVMDYSLLIGIHDMSKGNAALKALLKLEEFGPQNEKVSEYEKRDATVAMNKNGANPSAVKGRDASWFPAAGRSKTAQKDFADLQTLLKKATPEKLKQFDFADEYRSEFYFYHDHGGFQSTNDQNEELDVIYYVGVIDFLTGYTFRKSVETFCKSLIHDRKELSAVPAKEYGDRFLKFMRGCIGPAISSTKPTKRQTGDSQLSNASGQSADKHHDKGNNLDSSVMKADAGSATIGSATADSTVSSATISTTTTGPTTAGSAGPTTTGPTTTGPTTIGSITTGPTPTGPTPAAPGSAAAGASRSTVGGRPAAARASQRQANVGTRTPHVGATQRTANTHSTQRRATGSTRAAASRSQGAGTIDSPNHDTVAPYSTQIKTPERRSLDTGTAITSASANGRTRAKGYSPNSELKQRSSTVVYGQSSPSRP